MNRLIRLWLMLKLMWLESRKTRISRRLSLHPELPPGDGDQSRPSKPQTLDDRASQRLLDQYQQVLASIGRARYKLDKS